MYKSGAFWTADENLGDASQATLDAGYGDVTVMSWWTDFSGGVVGKAWVGTLCDDDGYNTNIVEAYEEQSISGLVSKAVSLLKMRVLLFF